LNILILGGTSFLGPHQIAYALERGHSVSTFTRGKTMPTVHQDLFSQVTMLIGDRSNDLTALEEGEWDVVIDNSGHNVEWTRATAELLKDRVGTYVFTSSTGVYYPYLGDNITEDTELLLEEPSDVEDEEMKLEFWYGVMKANSEIAAREIFGAERTLAVRPTYMFGPADKTNRFIHWPLRLAQGGEVLVPGKPEDPVQYADVRDVAEFMIRLIEDGVHGTYNAVGPKEAKTMPEFVEEAAGAFDSECTFVQVDDYEFLKSQGIHYIVPWIMPEGNNYGSARANNVRAIEAGMTFRNLKDSIRDTYEWWQTLPDEKRAEFESDPETALARETSILESWKNRG
jgi:2'-hydroxyisoflavone reductase